MTCPPYDQVQTARPSRRDIVTDSSSKYIERVNVWRGVDEFREGVLDNLESVDFII